MAEPRVVDLLIDGGLILTVDQERRIIENGAIAVDGSRIVEVGKAADLRRRFQPRRRVDATDRLVMPGFVNCHHHFTDPFQGIIPDDLDPGPWVRDWAWPSFADLTPDEEASHAPLLVAKMIRTGTTCVGDAGAKHLDRVVEAVAPTGLRAVLCKWTWDQKGVGGVAYTYPSFLVEDTDEALASTEAAIQKYHGTANGRIRISAGFEGLGSASEQLMVGLKRLADKHDTILYTHLQSSATEAAMWLKATDKTGVRYHYDLGLLDRNSTFCHMIVVNDEELALVKETDSKVVHNACNCFRLGKGASKIGRFADMLKLGITVALGIDTGNSGGTFDMVRVLHAAAGIPRDSRQDTSIVVGETAIEMATINGAKALGLEREIGSIEVGKKADLILFDLRRPEWVPLYNPVYALVWCASGDGVDTVIIDGQIVMENRRILTFDEEAAVRHAQEYRPTVLKRLAAQGKRVGPRWPVV